MVISDQELGKILLENHLVPEDKLRNSQEKARLDNQSLHNVLISQDLISDEQLGQIIADFKKIPFIKLSKIPIDLQILNLIPQIVAKKQQIIAFLKDKTGLRVAMSDPQNKEVVQFLEKKTGLPVQIYFATEKDIKEAFALYKKELQKSFDELLEEQVEAAHKSTEKEVPISKIVDLLIEYAYENKSSDIHIEAKDGHSLVRFRIDGVLHDVLKLPQNLHEQVVSRIKVLSRLRTDEHLSAQDGKMHAQLEEEDLDIRVSIVPTVEGEKAVLRLLSSKSRQFSLADLGMTQSDLTKVKNGFTKPYGMILATGPTGSGKTTTIYAVLKILNTRDKNIATIEDPVEYDIEGINQIQVNPKTNLTFASGLRAILRQDPDIIFVGEIRDEETADIAINSAMTGHLVLSTMHTNDAATTIPRLLDMKIEPFLIASTVNVVIGQRLVRKICEKCKVSQINSAPELTKRFSSELIKKAFGTKKEIRTYFGKGCLVCHTTGYVGRVGIFEVLVVTDAIKELVMAKKDSDVIKKKAQSEGTSTMTEDGLLKVAEGITTIEEILRATRQ